MRTLERRLGLPAAAAIGVASMLGAGVLFVWAPATAAAGGAVLIALPLAAAIAALNAASTIRLAMRHPLSGGVYASGRAELGPAWGFAAGVLFLVGKTASVAAIALVAGAYLWPGAERWVAAGLVLLLAVVNATGVRTTALVSGIAAALVITALAIVLVVALLRGPAGGAAPEVVWPAPGAGALGGVLAATGLIFFAFAGYARIATLGEEVRDPVRTLPRAALVSVAGVLVLGAGVLLVLLALLGTAGLAGSASPLVDAAGEGWAPAVRVAAAIACIGSLTGVLAGLSRTALAMGRDRELPGVLGRIGGRGTPVVAEAAIALLAVTATLLLDPARVIGVSACAVLGYYAIGHLAALRAGPALVPRAVPVVGLAGCVVVALATPLPAVAGVLAVVLLALLVRALVRRVA